VAALGDADGRIRQAVRERLIERGEASVPTLVAALASVNEDARWEAAMALGSIPTPSAAPALVEALRDRLPGVRWLAAEALVGIGDAAVVPVLHGLLAHSESPWMRDGAHHVFSALRKSSLGALTRPVLAALDAIEPTIGVLPAVDHALAEIAAREHA
jgi:HEAT repeat protein